MLAKFTDLEGRERWVNVKIEDSVEVIEGQRRVVVSYKLKRAGVREILPEQVAEWLNAGRKVLNKILSESERLPYSYATLALREELPDEVQPGDILHLLSEEGEITIKGEWIYPSAVLKSGLLSKL